MPTLNPFAKKISSSPSPWRHLLWILPVLIVAAGVVAKFASRAERPSVPVEKIPAQLPLTNTQKPVPVAAKPDPLPPVRYRPNHATAGATNLTATNTLPVPTETPLPENGPRVVRNVFEAQLALNRHGISSGPIDGAIGSQTRAALRAFQQRDHLPITGELDAETKQRLTLDVAAYTNYAITTNDLARLRPLGSNWLEKSKQDRIDYESVLELVAEKFHASTNLIRKLNPVVNWTNCIADTVVKVPNAQRPPTATKAAFIRISLSLKTLQAFDANTNLLVHFPCSIAKRVEKRPVGNLIVAVTARDPNYTFDPENFPDSPEAKQKLGKLVLQPGPNNPVGTVWIGLDRPGYGIHGTPHPEQVGRTESLGCFRLANWNAEYLFTLVRPGTLVLVEL